MSAAVQQLKELVKDQPANPLRPNQIQEYEGELRRLGAMSEGRDIEGQPRDWIPGDRGLARRRVREVRQTLDQQAPKRITGERAGTVHRLVGEVIETVIKPGMLPRSVMRRNPAGAVGHVLRTEFTGPWKDAALTVKRALRGLDPDNADPDYTNMERFRAEGTGDGTSTFMADAQIPGKFAQTPRAKANWPLGEPTVETALAQVQRRERAKPGPKPGVVYACPVKGCGKEYRGGFGKKNLERHQAKDHPIAQEATTA